MQEKEEQILDAALRLFVEKGFHGTPTSQIAKEAGVSNGTLFHYFSTKEILINKLYLQIKHQLIAETTRDLDDLTDTRDKFKLLWNRTIEWAINNNEHFYFVQQFSYSPYLSNITKNEIKKQKQVYVDLIEEGIKKRVFKKLPIDLIHTLTTSHIFGVVQYLLENPKKCKDKKIVKQSFELFWDTLKE